MRKTLLILYIIAYILYTVLVYFLKTTLKPLIRVLNALAKTLEYTIHLIEEMLKASKELPKELSFILTKYSYQIKIFILIYLAYCMIFYSFFRLPTPITVTTYIPIYIPICIFVILEHSKNFREYFNKTKENYILKYLLIILFSLYLTYCSYISSEEILGITGYTINFFPLSSTILILLINIILLLILYIPLILMTLALFYEIKSFSTKEHLKSFYYLMMCINVIYLPLFIGKNSINHQESIKHTLINTSFYDQSKLDSFCNNNKETIKRRAKERIEHIKNKEKEIIKSIVPNVEEIKISVIDNSTLSIAIPVTVIYKNEEDNEYTSYVFTSAKCDRGFN